MEFSGAWRVTFSPVLKGFDVWMCSFEGEPLEFSRVCRVTFSPVLQGFDGWMCNCEGEPLEFSRVCRPSDTGVDSEELHGKAEALVNEAVDVDKGRTDGDVAEGCAALSAGA